MKTLNPRQVEAFRAVMLTGNMTAAGVFLGVSQPAVSRLIHDFEHRLQLTLFIRQGPNVSPTPEAILLFEEVRRSFTGLEQIARTAIEIRGTRAGNLRIAAMPALALTYLAKVIAKFLADRPNVSVKLHSDVSPNILNLVATDQFDIGIGAAPMEHAGVRRQNLPTLEAACVVPTHHPLAKRRQITATDLQSVNLISLSPSSELQHRAELALREAGVTCRISLQGTIGTTLCSLVAENLGVAIVDPFTAASLRDERIVRRRFHPRLPYECAIVTPAYRPQAKLVKEFENALRRQLAADFGVTTSHTSSSSKVV